MPRGDGTGPNGMGSMTGRGAGFCAGYNVPGFMNAGQGFGRGFGRGRGFGGGYGRGYGRGYGGGYGASYAAAPVYSAVPAQLDPENEKRYIEADIKALKDELGAMEKRLDELKKS